ncbi:MAG: hypothetical protein GY904_32630 [Planctomycetaceae bacterium]|nr:hypothetical protein [Planctomycetaceae bacterium]
MQAELRNEFPEKPIQITAINEHGYESGNSLMSEGRTIPILQDVDADNNGSSDVWTDNWGVTYRDVKIVNPQNELVGTLNLTPTSGYNLSDEATYDALKKIITDVAHGQPLWQNQADPTDVNDDQQTTAVDALQCINELMLGKVSGFNVDLPLPMPPSQPKPYLDVNGDGRITANDAIRVINRLIEQTSTSEGEQIEAIHRSSTPEGEPLPESVTRLAANASGLSRPAISEPDDCLINTSIGQVGSNQNLVSTFNATSPLSAPNGDVSSKLDHEAVDSLLRNDMDLLTTEPISGMLTYDQFAD